MSKKLLTLGLIGIGIFVAASSSLAAANISTDFISSLKVRVEHTVKQHGADSLAAAAMQEHLARALESEGLKEQASIYYRRALVGYDKRYGWQSSASIRVMNRMAVLDYQRGKLGQSKNLFQEVLKRMDLNGLNDSKMSADAWEYLGQLSQVEKDYSRAIEHLKQALSIYLKQPSTDTEKCAATFSRIGQNYESLGEYRKAEIFYRSSLDMLEKGGATETEAIAMTLNNIGWTHTLQGEVEKAKEYYDQALKILLKRFSPHHPAVVMIVRNMGYQK